MLKEKDHQCRPMHRPEKSKYIFTQTQKRISSFIFCGASTSTSISSRTNKFRDILRIIKKFNSSRFSTEILVAQLIVYTKVHSILGKLRIAYDLHAKQSNSAMSSTLLFLFLIIEKKIHLQVGFVRLRISTARWGTKGSPDVFVRGKILLKK